MSLKRTPLKRTSSLNKKSSLKKGGGLKKQSENYKAKKEERIERGKAIHECFERVLQERVKTDEYGNTYWLSEESGKKIWDIKTTNLHHILHKNEGAFPQYAFSDWNIFICTQDEHLMAHQDLDKVPKIKARTEELKQKHYNGELE